MMITQDEKAAIAREFAPKVAKHTPGPWRVERQNPSPTTSEWMIAGEKPGYLAEVRDCGSGDVHANAFLIAAAPELLEAAKAWLEYDSDDSANGVDMMFRYSEALRLTRAAINKARF